MDVLFGVEFLLIYRGLLYTTASRAVLFIYLAPFFVVTAVGVAVDGAGNLYRRRRRRGPDPARDPGRHRLRGGRPGQPGWSTRRPWPSIRAGNLYISDIGSDSAGHLGVFRLPGGGGALAAVLPASLHLAFPAGVAVDAKKNVYVADPFLNQVVKVAPDGTTQPVGAGLNQPDAVAADADGNVFVATADALVRIPPAGQGNQATVTGVHQGFGVAVKPKDAIQLTAVVDELRDAQRRWARSPSRQRWSTPPRSSRWPARR